MINVSTNKIPTVKFSVSKVINKERKVIDNYLFIYKDHPQSYFWLEMTSTMIDTFRHVIDEDVSLGKFTKDNIFYKNSYQQLTFR